MKKRMRYWFDTEFIDTGETIDLISIGIVSEDNRHLYRCNSTCKFTQASVWVRKNVLPQLPGLCCGGEKIRPEDLLRVSHRDLHQYLPWKTKEAIRDDILNFCNPTIYGKPEFWTYYGSYDWVVLCQLFGRMVDLPNGWPQHCMDIKQWSLQLGNIELPRQYDAKHNALNDAYWVQNCWHYLLELDQKEA